MKSSGVFFNSDISRNQESLYEEYEKDFQPVYNDILKKGNLNHLIRLDCDGYQFRSHHFLKITQDIFKRFHEGAISKIKSLDKEAALKMKNFKQDINISGLKECNYYDFVYYVVSQYFRTLKIHESVKDVVDERLPKYAPYKEIDFSKVNSNNFVYLMSHYHTINITNILINGGYKLILIKNCTELNFITSDNPAINTYSYITKSGDKMLDKDEFEIFFPLSPRLAVLYSKKNNYLDSSAIEIKSIIQISVWNAAIKEGAQRYIYSDSEELVKIH